MKQTIKPSKQEIRHHYELERRLSDRLRHSTPAERQHLYTEAYDAIYSQVPYLLPQQIQTSHEKMASDLKLLSPYLNKKTVFLEVGPGNCLLSFAVAPRVAKVFAVDVSAEVTKHATAPANFQLVLSNGSDIPVPDGSIDFVFSNQLMEHLHPDDALAQLNNISRALKPGGMYLCRTPNKLSGPHDISRYFDDTATGFHLREYTITELVALFRQSGFKRFRLIIGAHGFFLRTSCIPGIWLEKILSSLPRRWQRPIARFAPLRLILGIKLLACK